MFGGRLLVMGICASTKCVLSFLMEVLVIRSFLVTGFCSYPTLEILDIGSGLYIVGFYEII